MRKVSYARSALAIAVILLGAGCVSSAPEKSAAVLNQEKKPQAQEVSQPRLQPVVMPKDFPQNPPVFPGTELNYVSATSEDHARYMGSIKGKTLDEVSKWYVDEFKRKGWMVEFAGVVYAGHFQAEFQKSNTSPTNVITIHNLAHDVQLDLDDKSGSVFVDYIYEGGNFEGNN